VEDGPSQGIGHRLRAFFKRLSNGKSAERFEEEVLELLDHGAEQGAITAGEGEMIQSIIELGETVAREIMVPRTSMVATSVDTPLGEVIALVLSSGHSRLPIFEGDIDHIIGILHAKDLLSYWGHTADEVLPREIIRPPIFVPATKLAVELLGEVRAKKSHMAFVLDEYGGTAGLITLEDIIEEIIGDIHDEYDVEEEMITTVDQNTVLVDARMDMEELEEYLGIKLPEGDYETLGGFIADLTGRVPEENESLEYHGMVMTIRSADERKISQVEIKLPSPLANANQGAA
jgi:CBS domain containing-hemolysin-like protein